MYYKKLTVPNYEDIRNELEIATASKVKENPRFWDESYLWFKDNTPLFYKFLEEGKKTQVRLCRFYLTPPHDRLLPHIDGLVNNKSPLGLNFPILGYEGTTMDWYDSPENNLMDGPYGFNKITASRVINFTKLKKIDSTIIDCPTFVRTDVVHGVTNANPTPRLVLSVRFLYTKIFGQQFEDVFKFG